MTRKERSAYWQNLVHEQTESGLSGAAFCREHHISLPRFYHWRRRFKAPEHTPSTGFFQLVPCATHSDSGIRISLGDELHIAIDRGFDPFTLQAVIEAVGVRKPCLP